MIFSSKKRRHPIRNTFIGLLFCLVLIVSVIVATNVGFNYQVRIAKETVTVWNLPKSLQNYTILHISDLHGARFNNKQSDFKKVIETLDYHVVVMTGDMVGKHGDYKPLLELIETLKPDVPVLLIAGDEDPPPIIYNAHGYASPLNTYLMEAERLGVIYLDVPYSITVGNATIWFFQEEHSHIDIPSQRNAYAKRYEQIAPVRDESPDNAAMLRALEYRLDTLKRLEEVRTEIVDDSIQIALSHYPITDEYYRDMAVYDHGELLSLTNTTLLLAGHFCGGQWRFPWNDEAIYIPGLGSAPDKQLYTGKSYVGGITQYISPGLGASGMYPQPGRLFNSPYISLITLSSK